MDGWTGWRKMDGLMDRQMDGRTGLWMAGWWITRVDWIDGYMDGKLDELTG